MAHPIVDKVYKTKRWQGCRAAYYATQHGICERCGEPGEIVHHIEELTPDNISNASIVYGFDNLQLLCWSCHERTKGKAGGGIPIREDISFNDDGSVRPTGKRIPPIKFSENPGGKSGAGPAKYTRALV
ncbi:hypothetical protein AGMMS49992_24270 [Clostridia bacterium]|nr:hypothetical protein AGMMS49992_24270 [Clostridia bacterium]